MIVRFCTTAGLALLPLLFLLVMPAMAVEENVDTELTAGQQHLVERYLEVVAAGDMVALKDLYHPRAFACLTEENRPFNDIEAWLSRHFRVDYGSRLSFRAVPYAAVTETADAVLQNQNYLPLSSMAEGWSFAVAPSHQVIILEEESQAEGAAGAALPKTKLLMVEDQGAWRLTYACTEQQGQAMREFIATMEKKAERAGALYARLNEETKQQLRAVLAAGEDAGQGRFRQILRQATGETDAQTIDLLAAKAYGELMPAVIREKLGN